MKGKKVIYLASPYNHPEERVEKRRFKHVCLAAAHLINDGFPIYSPIAMSHPIHTYAKGHRCKRIANLHKKSPKFWYDFDEGMMSRCSQLIILPLDGWRKSKGIAIEYTYFVENELPWTLLPWVDVISDRSIFLQWYRGDLLKEKAELRGV